MPSGAINSAAAIINYKNAKAHFGGAVNLNSNAFYNAENAVFDCDGDYTYGIVTINLGKFIYRRQLKAWFKRKRR